MVREIDCWLGGIVLDPGGMGEEKVLCQRGQRGWEIYLPIADGIDYKVRFNAYDLGIVLWMSINGYVSSHKLDFSEQARSYLYNSR